MNDWVDTHFNCSLTSMLTKCLYISTTHTKRRIILLVSGVVVKRKGNVPRTWNSQEPTALPICRSAQCSQRVPSRQLFTHTLSPALCKVKQFWCHGFTAVGWSHREVNTLQGWNAKVWCLGKLILPGAGSSGHCTAVWQLDGEDVHEELFTVRHRLSKIRLQPLHLCVTNGVSGGLHRGDCMQILLHSYLGIITVSD